MYILCRSIKASEMMKATNNFLRKKSQSNVYGHTYKLMFNVYISRFFRLVLSWSLFIQVSLIQICDHWLVLLQLRDRSQWNTYIGTCIIWKLRLDGVYVSYMWQIERVERWNENCIDHSWLIYIKYVMSFVVMKQRGHDDEKKTSHLLNQMSIGQRAFWP